MKLLTELNIFLELKSQNLAPHFFVSKGNDLGPGINQAST
jgi:hypothetical protein